MESPAQMSSTSAKPPSTMDRDGEKRDPNSISSQNGTEDEAGFAPIHTADLPNPISRKTTHSQSIARVRSNNGYGVSENVRVKGETGDEESEEFETNPFEVGWDGGDNDPECPRSMTKLKKWTIACIVCGGSFCVTNFSSIYSSTYDQMEAEFGNTRIISTLGLSLFVLGMSFGPAFFSPLSEFYGRRPIYLVAWTMYLIFIIPQAVSKNIGAILAGRFLTGFAGGAFLAVSGGTVGDLFSRDDLQAPMSLFCAAPFLGPIAGPVVGGFINFNTTWRWTYYYALIFTGILWVSIVFFVPETYHPVLVRKKAQRIRKETGDQRWYAPGDKDNRSVFSAVANSLTRPFELLIFEPMCLNLCIFSAILLGIIYLFFGAFPLIFTKNHGFNLWQVGLSFTGIGVGMIFAICCDPLWQRLRNKLVAKLEAETGEKGGSEPEFRLPPVIAGAVLCPVGIFWVAWTSYGSVHWILPIIGSAFFGAGVILSYTGIFTFLVDAYPLFAASALAANGFARGIFAAAFPLFGQQMYKALGDQWATSLLAFLTVAMMPFPYIFFKYGNKIRSNSQYARS